MEMSLNKSPYHPPLSSSSSRQSLHKETPSRPGTASSRPHDRHSRGQLPEGRPSTDETHQPPGIATSPCQDGVMDETKDHPEEGEEQPLSHPAFQPFFTLIEDAHTSDYYHPTVHYIFSDDDTDIVTEAAIRSLAAQQEALSDSKKDRIAQIQASNLQDEIKDSSNPDLAKSTLLPPAVPGVRENYVILDMEPSPHTPGAAQTSPVTEQVAPGKGGGTRSISSSPANASALPQDQGQLHPQYRVTEAQSFSSTWQVLNTEVVPAPTFENSNPSESPGHGLMLKIRGTGGLPINVGGKDKEGTLEEMMDQFAKRMSELQVVIDAAEAADSKGEHDEEKLVQHPFSPETAEETIQTKRDSAAYAEGEHS